MYLPKINYLDLSEINDARGENVFAQQGGQQAPQAAPGGQSMSAFQNAGQMLGMNENEQASVLKEYMANGGQNLDPQVTAWCAAFLNAAIEQSGGKGTGSNMARSFLDWGNPVDQPQRGDVAVFSRGDPGGPYGHAGFFDSYNDDGSINVLGGNQSDAVSISPYSAENLLGFRRG